MKSKNIAILAVIFLVLLVSYVAFERPGVDPYEETSKSAGLVFPDLKIELVKGIEITGPRFTVSLTKKDQGWFVEDQGSFPADETAVDSVLQGAAALNYSEIASDNKDTHTELEVDDAKGVKVKLLDGKGQPVAAFIAGKNGQSMNSGYVREDGSDTVVLSDGLPRYRFDVVAASWKDRNVMKFEPGKITALEIIRVGEMTADDGSVTATASQRLVFTKNDDKWTMVEPEERPGRKTALDSLVTMLANMRSASIPDQSITETGLEHPDIAVAVTLEGGAIHVLRIGIENPARPDEYYARNLDKPYLYSISKYQAGRLVQSIDELTTEPEPSVDPATSEMQPQEPPAIE